MKTVFRIRTNTVRIPRTFSNYEKSLMTEAEAKRRCDSSWWGCGIPRYSNTVLETSDARLAAITYERIRKSLYWCEFEGETSIDEVILDRREEHEETGNKGPWEVVKERTAMPWFNYYINEDGTVQGPDADEVIRKVREIGFGSVSRYSIRNGEGWTEPAEPWFYTIDKKG